MNIYENTTDLFLNGEIWKDINDFPDYQISNFGRIKSFQKWRGDDIKILSQYKIIYNNNYNCLMVYLYKNNKKFNKKVHILVYEVFNDCELKSDECIHHRDFNSINNFIDNLELLTKSKHHILHNSGQNNPFYNKSHSLKSKIKNAESHRKLKNGEILLIKKILNSKYYKIGKISQEFIGKMFRVSRGTISNIKNNRVWSEIDGND